MEIGVLGNLKPCQIGMIVEDVEKAKVQWAQFLGVPVPPTVDAGEYSVTKTEYRGAPAPEAGCNMAFFELENIQLELIQPNAARSTWRDFLEQHGTGVHHYAFQVADIFAAMKDMQAAGYELTMWGYYGDASGAYAYFDAEAQLGCYIELLCSFSK